MSVSATVRFTGNHLDILLKIDGVQIDLGFHDKKEATALLKNLEEIVEELSGDIERLK